MCEVFQSQAKIPIVEPREPTPLENGKVYLAPPGLHLVVEPDKKLNVDNSPLVQYSKPSIDVLFISAADAFRENLTGILVTGSNSDGALGMKMINENGGLTIVQDPKEAKMYRMPESAIRMSKIDHIMKSEELFKFLQNYGF
jgi:two-component system chemotaxis response regulator CheB